MTLALIIGLFVVGFILIGVELLVTPGFIIGVIGLLFQAIGIYVVYQEYGTTAGHIALASVVVLLVLFIIFSLRSGFWDRIASKDKISGRANVNAIVLELGAEGRAISALRPSGTALFNGSRYEVQSDGSFIDSQQDVVVSKIISNKIFVKPKT